MKINTLGSYLLHLFSSVKSFLIGEGSYSTLFDKVKGLFAKFKGLNTKVKGLYTKVKGLFAKAKGFICQS